MYKPLPGRGLNSWEQESTLLRVTIHPRTGAPPSSLSFWVTGLFSLAFCLSFVFICSYLEVLELGSQMALGLSACLETFPCALTFLVEELRPTEEICPRSHSKTLRYSPLFTASTCEHVRQELLLC